jgi:hypothetical protein
LQLTVLVLVLEVRPLAQQQRGAKRLFPRLRLVAATGVCPFRATWRAGVCPGPGSYAAFLRAGCCAGCHAGLKGLLITLDKLVQRNLVDIQTHDKLSF